MGIFPFFKKKEFFSEEEKERIVKAIQVAETETSGEIRLYVESKNSLVNPLERAGEIFFKLKMHETDDRNAVLLYIAMKDHELALFGDEGIYKKVGAEYWDKAVKNMIAEISGNHLIAGIEQCILKIGQTLKDSFPYQAIKDKNELPDDIVFGH